MLLLCYYECYYEMLIEDPGATCRDPIAVQQNLDMYGIECSPFNSIHCYVMYALLYWWQVYVLQTLTRLIYLYTLLIKLP